MSAEGIIAIIAVCIYVVGLYLANMLWLLMVEEIDRRNPGLKLYEIFGFRRLRGFRGYREYREACPNGRLHIYELACFAIAMSGMITLVILGLIRLASN
jgi:hypothetical protein